MSKILIVEDNEKNLKLFKLLLEKKGYETVVARNGKECIELVESSKPDLIIMDIHMPVMTGIDAIKSLRSEETTKYVPIIAATAYAMKGDKEQLLNQGFDAYLSKPIRVKTFLETVQKCLEKK